MKRTSARTRFSACSRHELARNIAERSSVRPNIRTSKTEFNFSRNVFGPKKCGGGWNPQRVADPFRYRARQGIVRSILGSAELLFGNTWVLFGTNSWLGRRASNFFCGLTEV